LKQKSKTSKDPTYDFAGLLSIIDDSFNA